MKYNVLVKVRGATCLEDANKMAEEILEYHEFQHIFSADVLIPTKEIMSIVDYKDNLEEFLLLKEINELEDIYSDFEFKYVETIFDKKLVNEFSRTSPKHILSRDYPLYMLSQRTDFKHYTDLYDAAEFEISDCEISMINEDFTTVYMDIDNDELLWEYGNTIDSINTKFKNTFISAKGSKFMKQFDNDPVKAAMILNYHILHYVDEYKPVISRASDKSRRENFFKKYDDTTYFVFAEVDI